MGWWLLLSGVAINIAGVISIKFGQHLHHQVFSLGGYGLYILGFIAISLSFNYLEVGLAYALWSGVGSLLVLSFGVLFFGEGLSSGKLGFFVLTMVGVIGMSLNA